MIRKALIPFAAFLIFGSTSLLHAQTGAEVQMHNHIRVPYPEQLKQPLPTPAGENPATIACIYNLVSIINPGCPINGTTAVPTGGSQAIIIVDAYDLPTAAQDLSTFSTTFGLPQATFYKLYANGKKPSSGCTGLGGLGNWGLEESLDIEYAHAMAPNAIIVLMEAASSSNANLYAGVRAANKLFAAHNLSGEISMSWGGSESSGETANDSNFTQPGVVYFASTGDSPGTEYPSTSPNVVAVGGTVINRSGGDYVSQSAWSDGGGGDSSVEAIPSFQSVIQNLVGNNRGVPDVALIAGTDTAIYNTGGGLTCGKGWTEVEGTSIAAPSMAGIINSAGTFNAGSNAENTEIYANGDTADFTDITMAGCGTHNALTGWDFCTGWGVPNGLSGK